MGRSTLEAVRLPYRMTLILHIGDAWIRGAFCTQFNTPLYTHIHAKYLSFLNLLTYKNCKTQGS